MSFRSYSVKELVKNSIITISFILNIILTINIIAFIFLSNEHPDITCTTLLSVIKIKWPVCERISWLVDLNVA